MALNPKGYSEQFTYLLPSKELASKYMAISAYNGSFSIGILRNYGISERSLNEVLVFCIDEGLLYVGERDRMYVTKKGFKHYGALFSLFYANNRFWQEEK
jgi:oxygen-independent coproporphyrinogen-3 oxidase